MAAEARLAHSQKLQHDRPAPEILHELQVYQIELEMQNDELRHTLVSLDDALNKYVDFYDFAPSGYITLTSEALIVDINLTGANLLGKARGQLLNYRLESCIAPESRRIWRQHFQDAMQLDIKQSCEICINRDDKSRLYVQLDSIRLIKDKKTPLLRIAMTDITRLKRIEKELHESEARRRMLEQREIAQTSLDGFWVVDAIDGHILDVNEKYCKMVGYSSEEILRMSVDEFEAIETPEEIRRHFEAVKTKGYDRFETRHRHKLGHLIDLEVSVTQSETHGGVIFAFLRDITERKHYEELLRQSQLQLKTFIRQAPISIAMFDLNMDYLATSGQWIKKFGCGHDNLIGRNLYRIHPYIPENWKSICQQCLAGSSMENREDMWLQGDAGKHWLRWAALPWEDDNNVIGGIIIYAEDITDKKNLELELLAQRNAQEQLQKLQVATQTVSAIAHEINQPLISITSYLEAAHILLHAASPDINKIHAALKGGEQQALRAGKSIRELLEFLAKREYPAEDIDLNDEVIKAVNVAVIDYDRKFRPELKLEMNIPKVRVNRTQLQKVLLNLINNGVDAMQEAGVAAASIILTVRTHMDDRFAQVTIQDSGAGVNKQNIQRLFEPFFTTKSNGFGMGLAVSRALIEENGGQLWFDVQEGRGAIFHFTLPFAR